MPDIETQVAAMKLNENYYVVQANELIRSKQDDLTLLEAKLIRLAIAQVIKDDTDLKTYTCNIAELARFLRIPKQNIYREMQNFSKNIIRKAIFVKTGTYDRRGNENYKIFHWIDEIEYKNGQITFKLSDSLKPYLIGLEELFTEYDYNILLLLPTNYSIRLYELIRSWINVNYRENNKGNYTKIPIKDSEIIFTVEYLRKYFNCEKTYPNTADFIKRVIDSSIAAITKYTTIRQLSYRKIKTGRTITHVVFDLDDGYDGRYSNIFERLQDGSYKPSNGGSEHG